MSHTYSTKGLFITHKPHSKALQAYIAYYYFHKKEKGAAINFIFYPHTRNGLTIYKGSNSETSYNTAITRPDKNTDYKLMYSGVTNQSISVTIHPPFDKVGVAFRPLGINNFISAPLSTLVKPNHDFDYYYPAIKPTLDELYDVEAIPAKVTLLDKFFLDRFQEFHELRLIKAVSALTNSETKFTVQNLADYTNTSRKTLLRLFKSHLNCSVKDFLHIVQFRKAITLYQTARKKPSLGSVALQTDYYDQSDFIKHFKKITGFNPKKFFNGVEHLGSEDTFWTFTD